MRGRREVTMAGQIFGCGEFLAYLGAGLHDVGIYNDNTSCVNLFDRVPTRGMKWDFYWHWH